MPTIQLYDSTGNVLLASVSAPPNGATATISTQFVSSGSYQLVVRGNGDYGNAGQYALSGFISAPMLLNVAAPSSLSATAISSSQVLLAWTDNTANETGYLAERSINGGPWTWMVGLPAGSTSFVDAAVSPGITYLYRVYAYNPYLRSDPSNIAAATIPVPEIGPPVPVSVVSVAGRTRTSVSLNWTGHANDTGYRVERSTNLGRSWSVIANDPGNTNSYTDRSVRPGRRYVYRVIGFNAKGDATPSAWVRVTIPRIR